MRGDIIDNVPPLTTQYHVPARLTRTVCAVPQSLSPSSDCCTDRRLASSRHSQH